MKSGFNLRLDIWFVVSLAFFLVFSALSVWQASRISQKQAVLDRIVLANQNGDLRLSEIDADDIAGYFYYRVGVSGKFDTDSCFFVENVVRGGKPGYYVYCIFQPAGNQRDLLVNLGWLRQGSDRTEFPVYSLQSGVSRIQGIIQKPRSKPVITPEDGIPNREHESLWSYFDFDKVKELSQRALYPAELQLLTTLDDQLDREWPQFEAKIGMHIGYAIHWAAFALATAILYFRYLSNLSRKRDE